ncbi:MAG: NUDIX hydrolase [Prevotellaceae bacterium]|nr:NUDIX hydrolase [Prevotellaceae bacterium]
MKNYKGQERLNLSNLPKASELPRQESLYYTSNPRFYVAVDCIIFGYFDGHLKVLLQKRDFEPFSGEMSVQGGFVQEGEDIDEAALRVLCERTGIRQVGITQVGAFGEVDRDPGARVISIAYTCLIDSNMCDEEVVEQHHGQWADIDALPPLHFGHGEMVRQALSQLRGNMGRKPVCFHLLPPLFTLTQMQKVYEAVLGEKLDKRNFRKRIADMPFIEKTMLIDKKHSKRGAVYYMYNEDRFKLINKFKV